MSERSDEEIIFANGQFVELSGIIFVGVSGGAEFGGKGPSVHFAPAIEHQAVAIILGQRNDLGIRRKGFAHLIPERGFVTKTLSNEDRPRRIGLIPDHSHDQGDKTHAPDPADACHTFSERIQHHRQSQRKDGDELNMIVTVGVHLERQGQAVKQITDPQTDEQPTHPRWGDERTGNAEENDGQTKEGAKERQPLGIKIGTGNELHQGDRP